MVDHDGQLAMLYIQRSKRTRLNLYATWFLSWEFFESWSKLGKFFQSWMIFRKLEIFESWIGIISIFTSLPSVYRHLALASSTGSTGQIGLLAYFNFDDVGITIAFKVDFGL